MDVVSRFAVVVALLHTVAFVAHASAHNAVPVEPTVVQTYFAISVVGLAPIVAAVLLATGRRRIGGALLLAAGLAAVWFGIANHYVIASVDNIASVPGTPAGNLFRNSAHALTATEIAAIAFGALLLGRSQGR